MASEANGPHDERFASSMRYAAAWFGQAVVRHITGAAFARAARWEAAETHVLPARQHNRPAVEYRAAQYVGTHAREDYPLRDTTLIVSGYVDRTTDRCVGGQAVDVYRLTGQTSAYRRMVDRQTGQIDSEPYTFFQPVDKDGKQDLERAEADARELHDVRNLIEGAHCRVETPPKSKETEALLDQIKKLREEVAYQLSSLAEHLSLR